MSKPECPRCSNGMKKHGHTPAGRQRYYCLPPKGCGYSTTNPTSKVALTQNGDAQGPTRKPARFARALSGVKRLIITSAQNGTPINEPFFRSLLQYCEFNDAELVVIPIRYKNPTSRWTASQANAETWAEELQPYLYNQRKKLNSKLVLLGDIKVQPTAERPLTGFEGITHGESGILGHPKLQLTTIPTPQNSLPKIMTTTGSVTVKNYSDSKAGKKGEFHHVFGACTVDMHGKYFHLRQVNAVADGSFIDMNNEYRPDGTRDAPPPLTLTMGDSHIGEHDPVVMDARLRLLNLVDPNEETRLVYHDLCNGRSVNPHEAKDPFTQLALHKGAARNVMTELLQVTQFVIGYGGKRPKTIVPSNHNDWVDRWLREHDWRKDPENAEFYLETAQAVARSAHIQPDGPHREDAFGFWMRKLLAGTDIDIPSRGESRMFGGVEHNYHGDKGPNGAHGGVLNMSRLGVRLNIGHIHAPGILGPLYIAGTSTFLNPPYTLGSPGSWLNTDILLYANGKRTLINYINGGFYFG